MASSRAQTSNTSMIEVSLLLTLPNVSVHSIQTETNEIRREAYGNLEIVRAPDEHGQTVVFMMVEDFNYPLVGQPIMRCEEQEKHPTYMLPADNTHSFALKLALNTSKVEQTKLDYLFRHHCTLRDRDEGPIEVPPEVAETAAELQREQQRRQQQVQRSPTTQDSATATEPFTGAPLEPKSPSDESTWGDRVASSVTTAGKWTAASVVAGAAYAARGIAWAGDYLRSKTAPCKEDIKLSKSTKDYLTTAKVMSSSTVAVSSALVHGVGVAAVALGKALSGVIGKTTYGIRFDKMSKSNTGKDVRKVGAAALVAFAEVWDSMEQGAKVIGNSTTTSTTHYVRHRYGNEYAQATQDGFHTAGNGVLALFQFKNTGVKAFVHRTAKETAKHTIKTDDLHDGSKNKDTKKLTNKPAKDTQRGSSKQTKKSTENETKSPFTSSPFDSPTATTSDTSSSQMAESSREEQQATSTATSSTANSNTTNSNTSNSSTANSSTTASNMLDQASQAGQSLYTAAVGTATALYSRFVSPKYKNSNGNTETRPNSVTAESTGTTPEVNPFAAA